MVHACSKTFLSLLNSLLIIFGIAWIILSFHVYDTYHSAQMIIGVIILAFFIIFIGLLGLIGALKQSKCALSIYIILVGLITLVLLAILITFCIKRNWFINKIINNYEKLVLSPKLLDNEKNLNLTREFLIKLECCGFKEKNEPKKIFNQIDYCNNINESKPLCNEKMKNDLQQNFLPIIIILAILTGLGALACLVAVYLACTKTNKTRRDTFKSRYR